MDNSSGSPGCVPALFACCVCRCAVLLDEQSTNCAMDCAKIPVGNYQNQRTEDLPLMHSNDEKECRESLATARDERSCTEGGVRPHPAIKGSRLTASGKYGALLPSPLTPCPAKQGACHANGGAGDDCESNEASTAYANVRTVAQWRSKIVASLPPTFLHQYAWFPESKNSSYVRGLWNLVQGGGTAPAYGVLNPSPVATQTEGCTHVPNRLPLPLASLILPTPLSKLNLPSPTPAGPVAVKGVHASSKVRIANNGSSHCDSLNPEGCEGNAEPHLIGGSPLSFTCVPEGLGSPPPESRPLAMSTPPSQEDGGTPAADSVEQSAMKSSEIGLKTRGVEGDRIHGAASLGTTSESCRELVTQFAQQLMRQVVHGSPIDLPLCLGCWASSLECQKGSTVSAAWKVAKLAEVAAVGDDVGVQPSGSSMTASGCCKQCGAQSDMSDLVEQESLNRLSIEVDEAEAHLACISQAQIELADEMLPSLKARRDSISKKVVEAGHTIRAFEVREFFEVDDTAAAVERDIQNMMQSYSFARSIRATSLAFPINTKGGIGTIARLRLGRVVSDSPKSVYTKVSATDNKEGAPTVQEESTGSREKTGTSCSNANEYTSMTTMQQQVCLRYSRGLLDKRQGIVSSVEINNACGYLLLLLQHLIEWHNINVRSVVLHPNGERSTVVLLNVRGAPPEAPNMSVDFFIKDNFFSRKTFDKGCIGVASCVREISAWMGRRLHQLRECVERSGEGEWSGPTASASAAVEAVRQRWVTPSQPPFGIAGDKVGGLSVRYGEVSNTEWSNAMKNLLDVVHWCVVVSCEVNDLQRMLLERGEEASD